MSLKLRINTDVKAALKAGDKARVRTLRMVLAAIKQREVDERIELDDADVLAALEKMIKQRRDSAAQFREGGREELAAVEEAEIEVLGAYLPEPLDDAELAELVDAAVTESGAASMADMGTVMAALKPRVQGRADMKQVSVLVKQRLSG